MTDSGPTHRGTLIWVHGTGVRKQDFRSSWANFQKQAGDHQFLASQLRPCPWGPAMREGIPDKRLIDAALPPQRFFGLLEQDSEELAAARTLLAIDPLFELRLHGIGTSDRPSLFGDIPSRLMTVGEATVQGSGIHARELASAGAFVRRSEEFAAAAQSGLFADKGEFDAAVARAVIARLEQRHISDPPGSQPAAFRHAEMRSVLLSRVSEHLGTDARVANMASDLLLRFARLLGGRLRKWATTLAVEFFADVF